MQLKYTHIYGPVLVTLWLGLFLDSYIMAEYFPRNQWLTNGLVILVFAWVFSQVSRVAKQLMIFGVFLAFAGEVILALGLGMYTYRLANVPLYVPLGHALVYAAVYYMTREHLVRVHTQRINTVLYTLIIIYSTIWLIFAQDVLGFACTMIILLMFRRYPDTKLFFLLMFFMVVYLELVGTYYQCWSWPEIWFGKISWVPSANPPSGISVIYFAFDAGCLFFYKWFNIEKWRRFRLFQKYRKTL